MVIPVTIVDFSGSGPPERPTRVTGGSGREIAPGLGPASALARGPRAIGRCAAEPVLLVCASSS